MINLKIGCIKIIALADCSSLNIGTSINMQNSSNEQNYFFKNPNRPLPERPDFRPEHPEDRPEIPRERPEIPEQIRQPPINPPAPGPIGRP